MSLKKLTDVLKGGRGSGNFGHSGRKGKIGGSSLDKNQNMEKTVKAIERVIRSVDNTGQIKTSGFGDSINVNLDGSDKFSMLGIAARGDGSIELRRIYMKDEYKRKGETGPASKLYIALGEEAKNHGTGKLYVYSPGEYTAQKKFWDRVPNAVIE